MKKLLLVCCLSIATTTFAQPPFPKGYFSMPINPGQITSLSGCYGDIRTNHFHSGIDVRTGGVEGKSVLAAAEGYVSRILVQNGGYGNAVYITHPNGYTTVYAHLKEFNSEISEYLTQKQYEARTWQINLEVPKDLIKVKKQQFIALSGNTGGSGGPHLHFEIRDALENTLDPQLFGFSELKDHVAPVIEQIGVKCLSPDALVNGKFGYFTFKAIKKGNTYTLLQPIKAKGTLGVEILTYDKSGNSPFRQGVHSIELQMNGKKEFLFKLSKMAFQNKLDMNIHVNYEKMVKNNLKIHKCYVEEGNSFDFYESNDKWGKLKINQAQNSVNIKVADSHGNLSQMNFSIVQDQETKALENASDTQISMHGQYLKILTPLQVEAAKIKTTTGKLNTVALKPCIGGKYGIYELDEGLPDSITLGNQQFAAPVNTAILLSNPYVQLKNLKANFSNALYENAYVNIEVNDNELYLHEDIIPLKGSVEVQWTKTGAVNYPEKQSVYLDNGNKKKFIGGEWDGKTIRFSTREFGSYVTLFDFDPPSITPRSVTAEHLRFTISDKLSGIKKIECYVNDEWVLMDYEYKTGAIWSRKLDKSKPFTGKVILKVTDNCNNTQSYETTLP